jgi:hypothetical protein
MKAKYSMLCCLSFFPRFGWYELMSNVQ